MKDEPRPLAVQIWDNDPATLAEVGAKLAHEFKVSVVDINFGCPVKQVTEKAHSGSYLLRYPDRVGAIVERVVAACAPTPVTAKIRLGCTRDIDQRDRSGPGRRAGRRRGADRPRPDGAGFLSGLGRLGPDLRDQAAPEADPADRQRRLELGRSVLAAFRRYDVDGVMIARAALNKPWLFQAGAARRCAASRFRPTRRWPKSEHLLLHHYELVCERFGEAKGTVLMRKYACCYAQGRPGAREFRTQVSHALDAGRVPRDRRAVLSAQRCDLAPVAYGRIEPPHLGLSCNLLH